jgi:uncharacterized protein YkwD
MMMSRIAFHFLCISTLLVLFAVPLLTMPAIAQRTRQPDRDAALEVLGLLNEWRLEEGLLPLKMNPTLEELALYQAEYVMSLRITPNGTDIHVGRNGEGILQRALFDQFDWPFYGRPERITVGEIAAVNSAEEALAFWHSSPPHRRTVTNDDYREIGIAAFAHPFGHLYIAVLGAEPDVIPSLVHPETHTLHLGNEYSQYATWNNWIKEVTEIRLFDGMGRPIQDDWIPWTPTIELPNNVGDQAFVLYTDGNVEVMSRVDLERDIIVLPGYYPPPDPELLLQLTPQATAAPTFTPEPPRPELLIVYDNRSLTIINQSRRALNLGFIELEGENFTLPMSWWSDVGNANIYQFPAGDCVQTWSGGEFNSPRKPSECRVLRSGRSNMRPNQLFWTTGNFDVLQDGEVVATCEVGARLCEVDLP